MREGEKRSGDAFWLMGSVLCVLLDWMGLTHACTSESIEPHSAHVSSVCVHSVKLEPTVAIFPPPPFFPSRPPPRSCFSCIKHRARIYRFFTLEEALLQGRGESERGTNGARHRPFLFLLSFPAAAGRALKLSSFLPSLPHPRKIEMNHRNNRLLHLLPKF